MVISTERVTASKERVKMDNMFFTSFVHRDSVLHMSLDIVQKIFPNVGYLTGIKAAKFVQKQIQVISMYC